jgi:hypothetical protein
MNWKGSLVAFGIKPRDLWRSAVMFASAATIIWLGGGAIIRISEAYDGLCPTQGPGLAPLLYDGNPLGYCVGIGSDLSVLGLIMGIAAVAVPGALAGWWYHLDRRDSS